MQKAQYDQQPLKLQAVGNGSYLYRWNIEQVTQPAEGEQPAKSFWQCNEVVVWNHPTRRKVTEAAIAAMWEPAYEAKLINDYNAAQAGLMPDSAKLPYLDFIVERNALKEEIQTFFDNDEIV